MKTTPWASIAVFDKKELKGFQLKGKVSFVTDEKEKSKITDTIIRSSTGKTSSKIFERISQNKTPDVLMFTAKAIHSLDAKEEFRCSPGLDKDDETIALLGR